ncbi:uncharacterized protein [Paramisgurnus dabryanus]|uniref:uncharacterized protein n=1 Tax=Paramisgurnus dabryanus TaxID=90735 RepID=UPI0031F4349F
MRSNFTGFSGHVNKTNESTLEVAFVVANCLVLLVTLHVGTLANLFVTWAVYRQKSLQTSNNALLVNLAVIDTLRCVIDCPLLLNIALSVRTAKDFGIVFCSAQIASFSLICCVQLFTLGCISAERYQAVARPFKNAERRKRITVSIILTWVVPISISVLCVIFAKDSPVYVRCRGWRVHTLDSYDTFGFYILTPVWCVCLAVIVGFYTRIFVLVRAHGRKIYDKGSFMPPEKKEDKKNQKEEEIKTNIKSDDEKPQGIRSNNEFEKEASAGMMASNLEKPLDFAPSKNETTTIDKLDNVSEKPKETKVAFKDELSNDATNVLDLDVVAKLHSNKENPGDISTSQGNDKYDAVEPNFGDTDENVSVTSTNEDGDAELNACQEPAGKTCEEGGAETTDHQNPAAELPPSSTNVKSASAHQDTTTETSPASNGDAQITTAPQEEMMGAVCMMPSLAQREKGNTKKESKLAKRSGYIIFTFLIFWIPLIGTVLLNHFFYQNKNQTVSLRVPLFTLKKMIYSIYSNFLR